MKKHLTRCHQLEAALEREKRLRKALQYYANGGWNVRVATEALKETNGND